MKFNLLFSIALLSGLGAWQSAQALELTVLGGYNYSAPTEKVTGAGDLQWTGDAGFSYGAFVAMDFLLPAIELESGLLFQNQKSERQQAGNTLFETTKSIQLPIVLRINFDDFIGVGVGYYFGYGQGNVDTNENGTTTSQSYNDANRKSLDSGLIFDLRVRYPLAPMIAIVFDGRYQHGLTNLEGSQNQTNGDSYYARNIQALLGFALKI